MAETYHNFRFSESNIFFRPGLEIPISLNPLTKLAFWRSRGPDARDESVRFDQLICPSSSGKSVDGHRV